MARVAWLHLSDWHQRGNDFGRQVVRDALLRDIRDRAQLAPGLTRLDFIVFSGDVAFHGKAAEYEAAVAHLFEPVLKATGLPADRLFIVPGNHDLDRDAFKFLPQALHQPFTLEGEVQEWLANEEERSCLLRPFRAYEEFVTRFASGDLSAYTCIREVVIDDRRVALLGLNSALMCARNRNHIGEVEDYGHLVVGEPQLHDALARIEDADLRIAVVHHPFPWLANFDRHRVARRLGAACHLILHGHEHVPEVHRDRGTTGDCLYIPAGASYDRRVPDHQRYANSYNLVEIDLETGRGIVYLRRWNDTRTCWEADTDAHDDGQFPFEFPSGSRSDPSSVGTPPDDAPLSAKRAASNGDVPDEVKQALEDELYNTAAVQKRILGLPGPSWLALTAYPRDVRA